MTTPRRPGLPTLRADVVRLIGQSQHASARSVNAVMTATAWLIGQRIVAFEQDGAHRARYGDELLDRLATDLTVRFGRGYSARNLALFRAFHCAWPILQTVSAKLPEPTQARTGRSTTGSRILQTASAKSVSTADPLLLIQSIAEHFPLPWSAYVELLGVHHEAARAFYHAEALRGGWTVRQLARQIDTQFYERTALSRDKAAMLRSGTRRTVAEEESPASLIKDPFLLEFLDLKDEYSETDLEDALIRHLEHFLLELGGAFTFIGRQRRLRVGTTWYRVDLLLYHRRLRCLVVVDLKLGRFTHADAGQMSLYLHYAQEHWTMPDENPPVGILLCARKDDAVAKYALGGLKDRVLATEYRTLLPDEKLLTAEIQRTRAALEARRRLPSPRSKAR